MHLHHRVSRRGRVDHALEREEMDFALLRVVAGVVVAVEVGGHAGIVCEQFGDRAGVPEIVDVFGVHRKMAEQDYALLRLSGGFELGLHPLI